METTPNIADLLDILRKEDRYIVLEKEDIRGALTPTEQNWLECICDTIKDHRERKVE